MAHLHRHAIQGLPTSVSIVDPNNGNLHWHAISNEITTTDVFGPGHRHRWRGVLTSTPIDDITEVENRQNG